MATEDEILTEAKDAFERCVAAEATNRTEALDDLRFARLGEQWDQAIVKSRQLEGRPCLTINRLPTFIRQVINDSRQNKPQIKIKPADSNADPETAEIYTGLIRNIEQASAADVAYDTAADFAASMGFGYFRIGVEYAYDDTFDRDIQIQRIANPFAVYADPDSTAADSCDWNLAFIVESMRKAEFEARFKGAEPVDWQGYESLAAPWVTDETVQVAEYWTREKVSRPIVLLSDKSIHAADAYAQIKSMYDAVNVTVAAERAVASWKVTQRLMTGAEILQTTEWAGRYIPIIPVYGEELNVEGERVFKSLIRDAKDAQRNLNYWRTTATELVALAPRAPWVGARGQFTSDAAKWDSANTENHSKLEYDPIPGIQPPQRQPFAGVPAGALQEAMNASDDIKAITGIYDASLGARSNETSGIAIKARQREGDVSTFHFIDNLSRAIKHAGKVIVDLIPSVYTQERIIRVLGEDGKADTVPLGQPTRFKGVERVFNLGAGKYDVVVDAGPGFTTRREEAAQQMIELLRAFPQAAPVIGDILAKNLDWPGAEEIAKRLQSMLPPGMRGEDGQQGQPGQGGPPQLDPAMIQQAMQQMQELQQAVQQLQAENAALKADKSVDVEANRIKMYEAQTKRLDVMNDAMQPQQPARAPNGDARPAK